MALSLSWSAVPNVYDPLKAGSIDGTDVDPHDKAIIRAMKAKYKPNKSIEGDPLKTVFVARLDRDTDEDTLWTAFRTFGKIQRCRLVRDIVTGFSKGYGFVEYEEESSAWAASRRGNRMVVDKAEVFVDMENERTMRGWVPRRLGGGIGGNKKSGQLRFGGKDRPFIKPILHADEKEAGDDFKRRSDRIDRDSWRSREGGSFQRDSDRDRSRQRSDRDTRRWKGERSRRDDDRSDKSERRRGRSRSSERDRSVKYERRKRGRSRSSERDRHRDKRSNSRTKSPAHVSDIGKKISELRNIQNEMEVHENFENFDNSSTPVTRDVQSVECVRDYSDALIKTEPQTEIQSTVHGT